MSTTPVFYKSHMEDAFFRKAKIKPGDFFLTASQTKANASVRSLSGSKYGHGMIYLGQMGKREFKTKSGFVMKFPKKTEKRAIFELPIRCEGISQVLERDKCYEICHVSPVKALTVQEIRRMRLWCILFAMAKTKTGERTEGYSVLGAFAYALIDAGVHFFEMPILPKEINPVAQQLRLFGKAVNAGIQSVRELVDGYPNLNCTSVATWIYDELGRSITTFSATTSPDDLYQAVTKN